jgi:N4-gp56 family major capsid protein
MPSTSYGDISPRTAAYAVKEMLERGIPYAVIEKFAQSKPLPNNMTKVVKFRRYEALPILEVPLVEGVTPTSQQLTATDASVTLSQFGGVVEITDVVNDTHEDPVMLEASGILGEQAVQTVEKYRHGVFKAGTNVLYANGVSRAAVNSGLTLDLVRKAVRQLKRQNARPITQVIRSTPNWGTENVRASYVALIHPDLEADIRAIEGFVPTEKYGTTPPWEAEIGKIQEVRFVCSTIFDSFKAAGGDPAVNGVVSEDGLAADVYPILVLGKDAIGITALRGQSSLTPTVVNPKPSDSDPLAQRGKVGWKTMQGAVILNDFFMVRLEVAAKNL